MFADFQSAFNILVIAIPFGFAITLIPSFISWGVWLVVELFKSTSRG